MSNTDNPLEAKHKLHQELARDALNIFLGVDPAHVQDPDCRSVEWDGMYSVSRDTWLMIVQYVAGRVKRHELDKQIIEEFNRIT